MSKYITNEESRQEGRADETPAKELDQKWRYNRLKNYKLSSLFEQAGMEKESLRSAYCSTYLTFAGADRRRLISANSCKLRLCTICSERKAHKMAARISQIMHRVELERPNVKYIFLTLTVDNCPGDQLHETLQLISRGWTKLIRHRKFEKAIGGWYRALEITRERERWNYYHPHIHAILAVDPGYFDKALDLYITQPDWIEMWKLAVGAAYRPTVDIRTIRAKDARDSSKGADLDAAREAAKYPVKDADYIRTDLTADQAAAVVRTLTQQTKQVRFTALGGWLHEASKDLDMDEDELRLTPIRLEVGELISNYRWSFGCRDYVWTGDYKVPDLAPVTQPAWMKREPPQESLEQVEIVGVRGSRWPD